MDNPAAKILVGKLLHNLNGSQQNDVVVTVRVSRCSLFGRKVPTYRLGMINS